MYERSLQIHPMQQLLKAWVGAPGVKVVSVPINLYQEKIVLTRCLFEPPVRLCTIAETGVDVTDEKRRASSFL